MPDYRRAREPGGTYFFTVVTFDRLPILTSPQNREILRFAWKDVQTRHPFETVAVCLLPDHLHAIWRLPVGDSDYPMRWKEIKRIFTREYIRHGGEDGTRNESRQKQGEAAIWQRRYWEHTFYDENDLNTHIDYVHYNPLKHGLVKQVSDWQWSTFHQYEKKGVYPANWGGEADVSLMEKDRGE
jgi:putative transposase